MSRSDGSGERAITRDGSAAAPYASPSVAPDGTIYVLRNGLIVRLAPNGAAVGSVPAASVGAPTKIAVSPDGTLIAYVGSNGTTTGTFYARTDGTGGEAQFGFQAGLVNPSWLDGARTVLDQGPAGAGQVFIDTVDGAATPAAPWFTPAGLKATDGEVSSRSTWAAFADASGPGGSTVN